MLHHIANMPAAESAVSLLVAAAVGMFAAVAAAVLPTPDPEAVMTVMDDARLRLICVAGSLGGAVLSVCLFKLGQVRDMAVKLVSSSFAGILFAPMVLRWSGWARDVDAVLAISGLTALLSWTVLQRAVPALTKVATKRFEGAAGTATTDIKP
jgi:hypothetical protein